jgi:urocanate hydratase
MPLGTPFGDWLAFPHLDGGAGLANAFTIGYRITDDGSDMWTARFNRFKSKDREAFAGGLRVMRRAIPDLITALNINTARTIFVPALSSSETHASESSQRWRFSHGVVQRM